MESRGHTSARMLKARIQARIGAEVRARLGSADLKVDDMRADCVHELAVMRHTDGRKIVAIGLLGRFEVLSDPSHIVHVQMVCGLVAQ